MAGTMNGSGGAATSYDDEDFLYNDHRATRELQLALETRERSVAEAHRQLAMLHMARRGWCEFVEKVSTAQTGRVAPTIDRTDKEG